MSLAYSKSLNKILSSIAKELISGEPALISSVSSTKMLITSAKFDSILTQSTSCPNSAFIKSYKHLCLETV